MGAVPTLASCLLPMDRLGCQDSSGRVQGRPGGCRFTLLTLTLHADGPPGRRLGGDWSLALWPGPPVTSQAGVGGVERLGCCFSPEFRRLSKRPHERLAFNQKHSDIPMSPLVPWPH